MYSAKSPNSMEAEDPIATRESMFGDLCQSVLKPTVKYLKFTKTTGSAKRNCVKALIGAPFVPDITSGSGIPTIGPIASTIRMAAKKSETYRCVFICAASFLAASAGSTDLAAGEPAACFSFAPYPAFVTA